MALTVEEIKIKVTSEDQGLKKLNQEITQLETKINKLQSNTKGNVSNFKWFKDYQATLNNAKIVQAQLTQSNKTFGDSFKGVSDNMGGYITNLATVIALQKAWEISLNSAKFEVLRSNFQGAESDMEAFRQSSAGTVSDANLIKLSNQASDLGVSLKQQTILMSLAEDAADKYGTGVEEGFSKVIMATEGSVKGLKSLGIQKEVYEGIVKDLAKAHGDEIDKLDAETQKEIRIQAIIQASGVTYEQATNKVKDAADEQEALLIIVGNLTDKYGGLVVKGLIPFYNVLLKLPQTIDNVWSNTQKLAHTVQNTADVFTDLISQVIDLRREAETAIVFKISVESSLPSPKSLRGLLPDNATLEDGVRSYVNRFGVTWEDAMKKVQSEFGFGKENDAFAPTKSKTTTSNKSGSPTQEKQTEAEILNLLVLKNQELVKEQARLDANLGLVGAEYDIRLKILEIEKEIARLQFGDMASIEARIFGGDKTLAQMAGGLKNPRFNLNDPRQNAGEPEQEQVRDTFADISNTSSQTLGFFQNILSIAGETNSVFAEILNGLGQFLGLMNAGKSLFDTIMSFIPGGGIISSVVGGVSGGGLIPQMSNGGGMSNNMTVILNNPVTFGKAYNVESRNVANLNVVNQG